MGCSIGYLTVASVPHYLDNQWIQAGLACGDWVYLPTSLAWADPSPAVAAPAETEAKEESDEGVGFGLFDKSHQNSQPS